MFHRLRLRQRRAMSAGLLVVIATMIIRSGSLGGPVRATEFEFYTTLPTREQFGPIN